MAALSDDVKRFAVQALACFDSPAQVIKDVQQEFGLTVTKQQLQAYNPSTVAGVRMSKNLKKIFDTTREAFLKDVSAIPIANQSYRLRVLNRMLSKVETQGNIVVAAALMEQAAKETGGAFTNKQKLEHTGKDGGPVQFAKEMSDMELEALARGG
jgi:hypothetical protein